VADEIARTVLSTSEMMSRYVTCKKCKERYLKADGIDEDALIEKHQCPTSTEERLAALEERVALLERRSASGRWRA